MKTIILTLQEMQNKTTNIESINKAIGEQMMFILLSKTNLAELRNPLKTFRKIVAKFAQRKDLLQILKYCKLVGLSPKLDMQ